MLTKHWNRFVVLCTLCPVYFALSLVLLNCIQTDFILICNGHSLRQCHPRQPECDSVPGPD